MSARQNTIRQDDVPFENNDLIQSYILLKASHELVARYFRFVHKYVTRQEELSMQTPTSPDERRSFVLKSLRENGRLTTADLASRFDISEDSARRDFRELAAEGLIQRVHGAALPVSSASQPFTSRYKISASTKARLAKLAVAHVQEGQVVLFDGGTTNLAIATLISKTLSFCAITNSPQIATALSEHRSAEIILLGGVFDPRSQMTVGSAVLDAVGRIHADICFTGIHGIDAEHGLTTPYYDEALTKAAMIAAGDTVIAVATKDKVGFRAAHNICGIGSVDLLVAEKHDEIVQQISSIRSTEVRVEQG